MKTFVAKCASIWTLLLVLAVVNGSVREAWLSPLLGPAWAHPVSGLTLIALTLLAGWAAAPWLAPADRRRYLLAGAIWLTLTVAFESLLGRFVLHATWDELLGAYDPTTGNLWSLVVLATLVAPFAGARWRRLI